MCCVCGGGGHSFQRLRESIPSRGGSPWTVLYLDCWVEQWLNLIHSHNWYRVDLCSRHLLWFSCVLHERATSSIFYYLIKYGSEQIKNTCKLQICSWNIWSLWESFQCVCGRAFRRKGNLSGHCNFVEFQLVAGSREFLEPCYRGTLYGGQLRRSPNITRKSKV